MMGIMDDDLDIDMAQGKEDKENAVKSKASKTWRILRLSSRGKLGEFDKIEDGKNLKALFESPQAPEKTKASAEGESDQGSGDIEKQNESGEQKPGDSNPQQAGATDNMAT